MAQLEYISEVNELGSDKEYKTTLLLNGVEIGSFEISGHGFDTGQPMSLGISVNDEHQGKGFSRELIKQTCEFVKKKYPKIRKDQLLHIDVDASNGFWRYIGMEDARYYERYKERPKLQYAGYEKEITFQWLCNWAGVALPVNGGSRKKYKRKTRKRKRNRKRKTFRKRNKRKTKRKSKRKY